eukprot:CAMPEP_0179339458 /NCGR_PEP_ID=MMETSP0797-20121207/68727_1 /TAXON_ID=47934 /ORGANISM="Dinophysis acuminata, Strain DAEP01" /LENGTH=32 /DNA_ID= /DNA_START= /DNA_END= /DNA_ORIENTATION=
MGLTRWGPRSQVARGPAEPLMPSLACSRHNFF